MVKVNVEEQKKIEKNSKKVSARIEASLTCFVCR